MSKKESDFDVAHRPGLACQHAFDWLAHNLYQMGDDAALIAGESWQAAEMLRRFPSLTLLDPVPEGVDGIINKLGIEQPPLVQSGNTGFPAIGVVATSNLGNIHRALKTITFTGCNLYFILEGRLARFMAEHHSNHSEQTISITGLLAELEATGFQLQQRLEIQGFESAFQHYLGEIAARANRFDLRDRRHFAMRRDFVSASSSSAWSTLVCLALERKQ